MISVSELSIGFIVDHLFMEVSLN